MEAPGDGQPSTSATKWLSSWTESCYQNFRNLLEQGMVQEAWLLLSEGAEQALGLRMS